MKKKILAFLHINKAAGTTLTHILRMNFFLQHFDVQQLFNSSSEVFQNKDLNKILRINPFIKSIAGHNIRVFSDLSDSFFDIRYITLLRDPLKRTISHYNYNVKKHGSKLNFYEYLQHSASYNRQTQIIAGSDNLDLAKHYIKNKYFLVGIVEEFDEFLVLLQKKLLPKNFRCNYKLQNVGENTSLLRSNIKMKFGEYEDLIIKRNLLDLELYKYVKEKILPFEKDTYGASFNFHVRRLKEQEKKYQRPILRYIDYVFRKFYYQPLVKMLNVI